MTKQSQYKCSNQSDVGAWDNPVHYHPKAKLLDKEGDNYTDVYFCPDCKRKFSIHSQYYIDCLGEEMENGCSY